MLKIKKSRRYRNTRKKNRHVPIHIPMMRGGTKVILINTKTNQKIIATDDNNLEVSRRFLTNIISRSVVSSASLCSMILKGDIKQFGSIIVMSQDMNDNSRLIHGTTGNKINTVCIKITLITSVDCGDFRLQLQWQESSLESCAGWPWKVLMKGSTTFSERPDVLLRVVNPDQVEISGATDTLIVNGMYNRTEELSGGQPVFRKLGVGVSETWIHYWPTSNEWIVTGTESIGKDDSGWARIAPKTIHKLVSNEKEQACSESGKYGSSIRIGNHVFARRWCSSGQG